jgi:hypothetical protein
MDTAHFDPCRRCKGLFFRHDMVAASKVRLLDLPPKSKARGWYCRECAWKMNHLIQLSLINGPKVS